MKGTAMSVHSVSKESIYQRVAAIDNMYVSHPMLRSAIDGLSDCVSWSAVSAEPRGALLTGIGGAGKTTVCKAILKRFPALDIVEGDSAIRTVPAFYASVPSPSTIRSLAASLLVSIGDPLSPKGSAASLTTRLAHLLKVCRTQMILLDEFHNLLAEAAAGQPHANRVCNWLRTLINETRVMVCLVGLPSCEALVSYDHQMSRRFAYRYRLQDLQCGTEERPGDLRGFLTAFALNSLETMQMTSELDFSEHYRALQIWAATGGSPAFIALIFKEAASLALIDGGRTVLQISDLSSAFERGITLPVAKISGNPFKMSQVALMSKIKTVY
jgi:hypothetical protein